MTIQECYTELGGDYQGTLTRLLKEDIIEKYLKKFPKLYDFSVLEKQLQDEEYEQAYRTAHKIKGVAMNLGLTQLYKACDVLCEDLRYEDPLNDVNKMLEDIQAVYRQTCETIAKLCESKK